MPIKILWLVVSLLGPLYSLVSLSIPAVAASALVFVLGLLHFRFPKNRWIQGLFYGSFIPPVYLHYIATGGFIRVLMDSGKIHSMDHVILSMDRFMLGWLFPQGQVSLWLDRNPWIGPTSFIGKSLTEFFQFFYIAHFLWGAALFGMLWFQRRWEEFERYVMTLIGAYYLCYLFYPVVPVMGPFRAISDQYLFQNDGFGMAAILRDWLLVQQKTLEDCFPSGHTAVAWVTAGVALKTYPRFGKWAVFAAGSITCATLYLRYHYVTDVIAAIPVVVVTLACGRWAFVGFGEKLSNVLNTSSTK